MALEFSNYFEYMKYVTFEKFNFGWFLHSIAIVGMLWVIARMVWMVVYQYKYGEDYGRLALLYGTKYCKELLKKK